MQLQGERFQLDPFGIAVDDLGRDLVALGGTGGTAEMAWKWPGNGLEMLKLSGK